MEGIKKPLAVHDAVVPVAAHYGRQVTIEAHQQMPGCLSGLSYSYSSVMPPELRHLMKGSQFSADMDKINDALSALFTTVKLMTIVSLFLLFGGMAITAYSMYKMFQASESNGKLSPSLTLYVGLACLVIGVVCSCIRGRVQRSRMNKQVNLLDRMCSDLTDEYQEKGINVLWKSERGDTLSVIRIEREARNTTISKQNYILYNIVIQYN